MNWFAHLEKIYLFLPPKHTDLVELVINNFNSHTNHIPSIDSLHNEEKPNLLS